MYFFYSKAVSDSNVKPYPKRFLKKKTHSSSWEWYEPPRNSVPVSFCLDTGLHGLRYVGQGRKHLCERVFWLAAFIGAVAASCVAIYHMWQAYSSMPIVTVFNPVATSLEEIPFPSVTICNVNNVRKSKLGMYRARARNLFSLSHNDTVLLQAYGALISLRHICKSTKTFFQRFTEHVNKSTFNFIPDDIQTDIRSRAVADLVPFVDPSKFLGKVSQKCEDMIVLCLWLDEIRNCSELFREVETDYGYCCTFNSIPTSLLMNFYNDSRESAEEVEEWRKLDLNNENLLFKETAKERKYPRRQFRPGRTAGLSVLLEPDLNEYFCTNTDSEGFVMALNGPLDFPRMKDKGLAVGVGKEVFVDVRPEITLSAESMRSFPVEKRKCYFEKEFKLSQYSKYTTSNCIAGCTAFRTKEKCGCIPYYLHRKPNDTRCTSSQFNCAEQVQRNIVQSGMGKWCDKCRPTCTEIEYVSETTSIAISDLNRKKLLQAYPQLQWHKDISVVHVYFGTDSTHSKLRKEMYTVFDLVSKTGGLLGLCMGFSILSLLEILYYCTLRLAFGHYRKRGTVKRKQMESDSSSIDSTGPASIKRSWFSRVVAPWGRMRHCSEESTEIPSSEPVLGAPFYRAPYPNSHLINPP